MPDKQQYPTHNRDETRLRSIRLPGIVAIVAAIGAAVIAYKVPHPFGMVVYFAASFLVPLCALVAAWFTGDLN